jgi:hypothetical protein
VETSSGDIANLLPPPTLKIAPFLSSLCTTVLLASFTTISQCFAKKRRKAIPSLSTAAMLEQE